MYTAGEFFGTRAFKDKQPVEQLVAFDIDGDGKLDVGYRFNDDGLCRLMPVTYLKEPGRTKAVFDAARERPCLDEDVYFLHNAVYVGADRGN